MDVPARSGTGNGTLPLLGHGSAAGCTTSSPLRRESAVLLSIRIEFLTD